MQQELFETDIEELPLLFGNMMKVGRRLLHCKLRATVKGTRSTQT